MAEERTQGKDSSRFGWAKAFAGSVAVIAACWGIVTTIDNRREPEREQLRNLSKACGDFESAWTSKVLKEKIAKDTLEPKSGPDPSDQASKQQQYEKMKGEISGLFDMFSRVMQAYAQIPGDVRGREVDAAYDRIFDGRHQSGTKFSIEKAGDEMSQGCENLQNVVMKRIRHTYVIPSLH